MGEVITNDLLSQPKDAKQRIETYWTHRTKGFTDLRVEELYSNKYKLWEEEITKHLPGKQLKVLDVGCACGFFSIILTKNGCEVTGIDLTETMIEQARELALTNHCNINYQVMDAENLDFQDETFDVVISRNLTWTLPNPRQAYSEWIRVLKKGGMLLNYDGEYAKHHHDTLPEEHAHVNMDEWLTQECHNIYHMLKISGLSRPEWDIQVLESLACQSCSTDLTVGQRIYGEKDIFYITTPMFCMKAIK